ncbi:alpha/beta hydrolase [Striga asiatica]|uniref:Alpha/beta hydrolase n=1 Tax=Striga asiatica TaxID=4170 RepID=A0A5A7PDA0_STRAF|nr:alpha/beta hydrolase [Striga asiatica]
MSTFSQPAVKQSPNHFLISSNKEALFTCKTSTCISQHNNKPLLLPSGSTKQNLESIPSLEQKLRVPLFAYLLCLSAGVALLWEYAVGLAYHSLVIQRCQDLVLPLFDLKMKLAHYVCLEKDRYCCWSLKFQRWYAKLLIFEGISVSRLLDYTNVHCLLPWWEDATVNFMP